MNSAGAGANDIMLLDGVMLLWFLLTALSVIFVAIDIRTTPEHPVMKLAFILFTVYAGPVGAFLYVLGCREPLPGLHERYTAVQWRQALGSTMHCVAGDGIGILAGAVIGALVVLPMLAGIALEYVLGFAFGWTIFQALFMRDAYNGSYAKSLAGTFLPELLSMNCLMGGMLPVAAIAFSHDPSAHDPTEPLFWFRLSLALMVGAAVAFPINWWLVEHHLKHGMMTVRPSSSSGAHSEVEMDMAAAKTATNPAPRPSIPVMTAISFGVLALGAALALAFGGGH
jgi:uncharacterized protein DUF4396